MHELIERYLDRVQVLNSDGTHRTYRSNLKQFNEWIADQDEDITTISPLTLEEFFLAMNHDGYAPKTIACRFQAVRGFYEALAGKFDVIDDNPVAELERSDYVQSTTRKHDDDTISYVTPAEKEQLCEHVPTPQIRNELIVRLLWQTGIRKSELITIELEDLNRDDRSVRVWSPKTKAHRTVYYQPSLDVLLTQWLDHGYRSAYPGAGTSPYLFVTDGADHIHPDTVNEKVVKQAAFNAGIQEVLYTDQSGNDRHRITPHALRHGHAVQALKSGIDVRTVQQHLGHANLEMTMQYLQLIDDDVKDGYRKFAGTS